jgi:hypothetical protein
LNLAVAISALVVAGLAVVGFGPSALAAVRRRRAKRARQVVPEVRYDPGRERRAERKARELLRAVVSDAEYDMYVELGFLSVAGADDRYAYLVYPHRPILAYDTETDELLSEYCVTFPDRSEPALGERLPDADDVLAKWMSLRGSERELIAESNMHAPGRQIDPGHARRDLARLRQWQRLRANRVAA